MSEVPRADVLTRWIGLLPFPRGPKGGPWETGRHDPAREQPVEPAGPAEDVGSAAVVESAAVVVPPPVEVLPPLVPAPPPLPPRAPDLGRITPAPTLVGRGARRGRAAEPRGAVVDGIEHRPPITTDEGLGLSRRLRGRLGSRAFALFFLGVYLLIVLQLIYVLMNG
ncbi:hypothetical protein [Pseudonocardia xishanensis]|uniref:Uncharacterized protein n=1 Tax=Pseudonocardia xishanensis TaxID=630995 RepID=A0ABP8REQ9_9PSEU